MEVEILVAEISHEADGAPQMFHLLYDGTVNDETDFAVLGGEAEAIHERFASDYRPEMALAEGIIAATAALAGPERDLGPDELEVAELAAHNGRRSFRRIEGDELARLLG